MILVRHQCFAALCSVSLGKESSLKQTVEELEQQIEAVQAEILNLRMAAASG